MSLLTGVTVDLLEGSCYAAALNLITVFGGTNDSFLEIMLPELVKYRSAYATNRANWSDVEKDLATYLN